MSKSLDMQGFGCNVEILGGVPLNINPWWDVGILSSELTFQCKFANIICVVFASTMSLSPFSEERNMWDESKEQWHKG